MGNTTGPFATAQIRRPVSVRGAMSLRPARRPDGVAVAAAVKPTGVGAAVDA